MTTASWTVFSLNILFTGQTLNQVPQANKKVQTELGVHQGEEWLASFLILECIYPNE